MGVADGLLPQPRHCCGLCPAPRCAGLGRATRVGILACRGANDGYHARIDSLQPLLRSVVDHGERLLLGNPVCGRHISSVTNERGLRPAAREDDCHSMCITWHLLCRTPTLGCTGISLHAIEVYGTRSIP